jgi:shikimate kinase
MLPIMPIQAIVLIGPPGAGKSYLGRYLADLGIAHYTEFEPILVHQFGQGAQFAQNKHAALAFLREQYHQEFKNLSHVVVLESTGLSDRPIIEEIARQYRCLFVKVNTAKDVCIERVSHRQRGRNISNDVEAAQAFYDFWQKEIAPSFAFDVVVTGEYVDEAIKQIRSALK